MWTSWWSVKLTCWTPFHAYNVIFNMNFLMKRSSKIIIVFIGTSCEKKQTVELCSFCQIQNKIPRLIIPGSTKVVQKKLEITKNVITAWAMAIEKWYSSCSRRHLQSSTINHSIRYSITNTYGKTKNRAVVDTSRSQAHVAGINRFIDLHLGILQNFVRWDIESHTSICRDLFPICYGTYSLMGIT